MAYSTVICSSELSPTKRSMRTCRILQGTEENVCSIMYTVPTYVCAYMCYMYNLYPSHTVYVHVYIHANTHSMHTCTCTPTPTQIRMYLCTHTNARAHTHAHTHTHTHTHTQTQTQTHTYSHLPVFKQALLPLLGAL